MAVRRKSFGKKKVGTDDVVILDIHAGEENQASFHCKSRIPGMVLVDFITGMDEDDPASMGTGLMDFFDAALREDELPRFLTYVRDPANDVDLDDLSEMAGWLAEQFSGGNPTVQSPESSGGSTPTGLGNLDVPSELAAI